ncbi:hypothetical protein AVEN_171754-1 [Araneus ventricosus]|uniref:Uncharacterized protein n=1 Tax=Araneus ventricosus TaxID=182803 RepID=A0A4Y2B1W3_ARAVE|nr:hypothetical protein AVEN_171754-1 [Araneus ventricosus]
MQIRTRSTFWPRLTLSPVQVPSLTASKSPARDPLSFGLALRFHPYKYPVLQQANPRHKILGRHDVPRNILMTVVPIDDCSVMEMNIEIQETSVQSSVISRTVHS